MTVTRFFLRSMLIICLLITGGVLASISGGRFIPEGWQVLYARQGNFFYRTLWWLDTSRGLSYRQDANRYAESIFLLSPDGRFLLATRFDEANTAQTRIFDLETGLRSESIVRTGHWAWSPDSRQLVFTDVRSDLFFIPRPDFEHGDTAFSIDDATLIIRSRTQIGAPVWSPDGAYIAYQDERQLYVVTTDGSATRTLISTPDATARDPAWSPDSRHIAFVVDRDGNPEIYVVDVATGALMRITNHPDHDLAPLWSPDGTRLVFLSDRRYLLGELIVAELSADQREPLRFVPLDVTALLVSPPQWSLDGEKLVYISGDNGEIERVNVETGQVRQLTNEQQSHRLP